MKTKGMRMNANGSVDLYIGPTPPVGPESRPPPDEVSCCD